MKPSAGDSRYNATSRDEHLGFEGMISDFSAKFVNIDPDDVDKEIEAALEQLLEFFHVDRCGLLSISPDRKRVHVTHAAYAEGIEQVSVDIDLATLFPWSHEKLVIQQECVSVSRMKEPPLEAEKDRQSWTALGVLSSLIIPLFFGGRISSLFVIASLRKQRFWPLKYFARLRLLGEIFINALELRRIVLKLRESEERLNLAADAAEAMFWTVEVDSGRIWSTDKAMEFFGLPLGSDLDIESFLKIVHDEDRAMLRRTIEAAMLSAAESTADYRIVRPDGSIRWILSRGRSFPAVPGAAARMMGVSIDITERKPGLGLSSMRERAQLVQGDFSIRSQPGQGSVIRICVPLTEGGE